MAKAHRATQGSSDFLFSPPIMSLTDVQSGLEWNKTRCMCSICYNYNLTETKKQKQQNLNERGSSWLARTVLYSSDKKKLKRTFI